MKARMAQKCVYGDEMFLSTISLKHPSPINCVLHINLYTSGVECSIYVSPHQSVVDYPGHFMTYVILSILSIVLVIRVQKLKITDRLWCKLLALSKHVKLYDKL